MEAAASAGDPCDADRTAGVLAGVDHRLLFRELRKPVETAGGSDSEHWYRCLAHTLALRRQAGPASQAGAACGSVSELARGTHHIQDVAEHYPGRVMDSGESALSSSSSLSMPRSLATSRTVLPEANASLAMAAAWS